MEWAIEHNPYACSIFLIYNKTSDGPFFEKVCSVHLQSCGRSAGDGESGEPVHTLHVVSVSLLSTR